MRDIPQMASAMRAIRDHGGSASMQHTARHGWSYFTAAGAQMNAQIVNDLVDDGWLKRDRAGHVTIDAWPAFADRTTTELIAAREHVAELIDRDRAAIDRGFYGTPAPEPRDADNWT